MIADTERLKSAPKLSFDNGGEFIRQTRREVEEYLSARGTRVRGRVQLYAKGVVALVVLLGSWLILMFGQPGVWLGLLSLGGMILGTSLIAFSVMHDANHGAYFQARRLNHLMGWTADALLGLSSYAWRVKHNVAHHTYTNVDGYDADITQVPFARLAPGQLPRPWYRLQHYYIWALYCVMALRWQTVGDIAAFSRGSIGTSALRMPRRWDLAGLIGGKVIFVTWAIVVPLLVYPWWAVLSAYLVYSMVVSLIMAVTFQPHTASRRLTSQPLTSSPQSDGSGRCTRSRRRSTSARATRFSAGSSEASTTRSSTTYFPGCRTLTTQTSPRSSSATPSVTVSATSRITRCAQHSDRTSDTFARWDAMVSRSRSRWAKAFGLPRAGGISTNLPRIAFQRGLC